MHHVICHEPVDISFPAAIDRIEPKTSDVSIEGNRLVGAFGPSHFAKHEITILVDGVARTFQSFESLPSTFDRLVKLDLDTTHYKMFKVHLADGSTEDIEVHVNHGPLSGQIQELARREHASRN